MAMAGKAKKVKVKTSTPPMKKQVTQAQALRKVRNTTLPESRKQEKRLVKKVQAGTNISLYARNKNPAGSVQGTGFSSAEKARATLTLCAKEARDLTHQKQIVLTMFNRAKFHPHQSAGMREAMAVFAPWMRAHGMQAKR